MNENEKYYKNLAKSADFMVLVSSNVIHIINDKILIHNQEMGDMINNSNIPGLKKRHLIWNDLLRNYTTLLTSINNLISFNHVINYSKKSIIREMSGDKDANYISRKISSLENASNKFIEYTKVLLLNLDYFSKNLDVSKKSKEIQNLTDVHQLITKALDLFDKKHLPKVKQLNSDLSNQLEKKVDDKKGKGEDFEIIDINNQDNKDKKDSKETIHTDSDEIHINDSLRKFVIDGGYETNELYQVFIGGTEEESRKVMIGGFQAEDYVKQKFIRYQLIKKDLEALNSDKIEEYYETFLPELKEYLSLSKLEIKQLFKEMIANSGILDNISQQIFKIVSTDLPKLLSYHANRFSQKNEMSISISDVSSNNTEIILGEFQYSDVYGKIELKIEWNPYTVNESISLVLKAIKNIFHLIDNADQDKILKDAKSTFKSLRDLSEKEKFMKEMASIRTDFQIVKDPEFSFESRFNAKDAINKKIESISNLLKKEISPEKIVRSSIKSENLDLQTKKPNEMIKNMKYLLKTMDYVINSESALVPTLQKYEKYYDSIVNELYDLMIEINTLISPDNKHTCIKRSSLIIELGLRAVILKNITRKWEEDEQIKNSAAELNEVISFVSESLEQNVNKFYDSHGGLNLEEIKKIATSTIGKISL